MKKIKKVIKAWLITDWDGKIRNTEVSIFKTKKKAMEELKYLNSLPEPTNKGENVMYPCEIIYQSNIKL